MKRDVSLGKKFVNLISSWTWIFIKNFSEALGFLHFAIIEEMPQQMRHQLGQNQKLWFGGGGKSRLSW